MYWNMCWNRLCAGIDSGIEAAVHSMARSFQQDDTEAILLVFLEKCDS